MSYQYHGTTGLITLPGREVQTFPSGLVRITRTYVCRRGFEGQFRQLLAEGSVLPNDDAAPCIDGAYIFPTPLENIRDDGFVEFRVTAYGRANATGTEQISEEITTESYTTSSGGTTINAVIKNETLTKEIVLTEGEEVDQTTSRISAVPEVIYDGDYSIFSFSGGELTSGTLGSVIERTIQRRRYGIAIRSYTARKFGRFTEVTVVYGPFILIQT